MTTARRRFLINCAGIAAVLLAAGCASRKPYRPVGRPELEATIRSRGATPIHIVVPYRLNSEMRTWLDERVSHGLMDPRDRLLDLSRALFDSGDLGVEYARGHTGTAREVFETRKANCLAFTHMFVGMARELDIPAYFLEVRNVENFKREGDLIVVSDHVAVGHGPSHDLTVIDFGVTDGSAVRKIRAIDDMRAIAMFYSNRGAEELRHGRYEEALQWLRSAVAIDPGYDSSWVNLGVALRRSGDLERAELAYRTALELDVHSSSAVQNLAALLAQRVASRSSPAVAQAFDLEGRADVADRTVAGVQFQHIIQGHLTLGDLGGNSGEAPGGELGFLPGDGQGLRAAFKV